MRLVEDKTLAKNTDLAFEEDRAARFDSLEPPPDPGILKGSHHSPEPGEPGYARLAEDIIASAFRSKFVRVEDTIGERSLLAWRLTRELARHMGILKGGESLTEALKPSIENLDPWTIPRPPSDEHPSPGSEFVKEIVSNGAPAVISDLAAFREKVPQEDWVVHEGTPYPGVPILPPLSHSRESGLFALWTKCVDRLASSMALSSGTTEQPDLAEHALPQLLLKTHEAWPSRSQIVSMEEIVTLETVGLMAEKSQWTVMRILGQKFGLMRHEQKAVVEMARLATLSMSNYDVEEARGMMVLRLERYIERCQESMDLRAELAAMKQLAIVQGLARSESGDLLGDFTKVVTNVAARDKQLPKGNQ